MAGSDALPLGGRKNAIATGDVLARPETLRRPCREPIREPARSSVNGASVQSALASGGVRCPAMHRAMWTQGPGIHHFANGALATAGDGACAKVPYRGAEPAPRTASAWNARQTPSPRFRCSAPRLSSLPDACRRLNIVTPFRHSIGGQPHQPFAHSRAHFATQTPLCATHHGGLPT